MKYIYEQLKDENKIYEVRDDKRRERYTSKDNIKDSMSSNSDIRNNKKKPSTNNMLSNNSVYSVNNNYNNNSNKKLILRIKNDNIEEPYIIAQNYIEMLKHSEFYMI